MYFHASTPAAVLSIAPCGFAGCTGAGCDEMLRVWHQQPEGSYHAGEPRACLRKYFHSVETAQPRQPPAEFITMDGTFPIAVLITSLGGKGMHLWSKPKKKGQNSQFFVRNGEDLIYMIDAKINYLTKTTK